MLRRLALSREVSPVALTLIVRPFCDGTRSRATSEMLFSAAAVVMPSQMSFTWGKSNLADRPNITDSVRGCDMRA